MNDASFDAIYAWIVIAAAGIILPACLLFLLHFTGSGPSVVLEETSKLLVLFFSLPRLQPRKQWPAAIIFGFLFGLSENIFYFNQLFQSGASSVFGLRLLTVVPMHILTILLLLPFVASRRLGLILLGLLLAIAVHFGFNQWIAPLLVR